MEDSDLDDILNDILQDDEPIKKKTPIRSSTTQPQAPTAPGYKPEPSPAPLATESNPEPSPGLLTPGFKPEPSPVNKGNPAVKSAPKNGNAESDKQNKKKLMQELFLDKKEKEDFPKTDKVNLQEPRKTEPTKSIPKPEVKEVLKEKVPPENSKMDFDDDILGKIEKPRVGASKASFMDDIFGKKSEKESKSSFLDDLMSGETGKRRSSKPENDFVLDSKYKKIEDNAELNPQPRRRRGNPEVQTKETLFKEDKTKESISAAEDNPFPWMAKKSETKPPQEPPQQQQQNIPQQPPGATQQPQQPQVSTYQPEVGQQPPMPIYQQQAPFNPVPNPYLPQPVLPQYQPQLLPTHQYQPLPLPDMAGLERTQAEAFNREMENLNQVKIITFH